jgi:ATP-dependent RNA helicase DeaD
MSSELINPVLAKALADRGYATLTPVQQAVLEPQASGRDLLVSARTGSGKTVAYGLVLAENLLDAEGNLVPAGKPSALVIAPTRELAMQVQRELQWLYAGAKVASCVGGMDPRSERRALDMGCHIVVGTPGRLRDHLERGVLRLDSLSAVILDEADEMLDLGFREELEEILDATPPGRRTLLFSATLPKSIVHLASTYQQNALRLLVGAGETAHSDIDYRVIAISPSEVELATVNVLRFFESGAAIVFCATREGVRKLHANLVERGFSVVALSGELTQNERTHALQALRDRRARVCVATDVAARGIDIPDLDLVIHADLPTNRETMQHRSGRTGRAGRKGVCVILVPHPKRKRLDIMLKGARINAVWQPPPTVEDIRAKDQMRLIDDVKPISDASDEERAAALALIEQRSVEDIAAAYIRLARQRMPAPEDLAESEPEGRGFHDRFANDRFPNDRGPQDRGPDRGGDGPRAGFEDAVWFRLDLGRNKGAEARWLLPMLCRRGHVTKRDIGAIRVFDRETRFQIAADMVDRFLHGVAKSDDDGGRIDLVNDNTPMPVQDREPRAPYDGPPRERRAPRREFDQPNFEGERPSPPERKPRTKPRSDRPEAGRVPDRAFAPKAPAKPQDQPSAGPKKFKKPDNFGRPDQLSRSDLAKRQDKPAGDKSFGDKPFAGKKPPKKKRKPNG